MQIPKHKKLPKRSTKYCTYLSCNKEFFGTPVQKYCDVHKDPHNRKRIRPKPESPSVKNMIFAHNFNDKITLKLPCNLNGCGKDFNIDIYPDLYVYPKYCEDHRNEYRRSNFLRLNRKRGEFK